MPDPCPLCGKDRVLVGRSHNCNPIEAKAKPQREGGHAAVRSHQAASRHPPVLRKGRPRIEDREKTLKATKPWEKLGMSERSWYRRRAKLVDNKPQ